MHMCLMGRTKFLSSFFHRLSLYLRLAIPYNGCNSKKRCSDALSALFVRIIEWTAKRTDLIIEFPDNWEDLSANSDEEEADDAAFCASCTKYSRLDFASAQAYFWVQLPIYFGLPKWNSM